MKKDWVGNNVSIFKALGATNHSDGERANQDYYATDSIAIDKLATKFSIPKTIWEPCCGEGHLSKRLKELGHDVYSSDIEDRGYGDVIDFLSLESYAFQGKFDCILTNPPYAMATECILRALELLPDGGCACFFLKTTALEGRKRYEHIFRNTPPKLFYNLLTESCVQRTGILQRQRNKALLSVMHGLFGKRDLRVKQRLTGYET